MSKTDALVEVARKLKDARGVAEKCPKRTLLYFIDMAIFEACEALAIAPDAALERATARTRPRDGRLIGPSSG